MASAVLRATRLCHHLPDSIMVEDGFKEGGRGPVKRVLLSDGDLADALNWAGIGVVVLGAESAAGMEGEG